MLIALYIINETTNKELSNADLGLNLFYLKITIIQDT